MPIDPPALVPVPRSLLPREGRFVVDADTVIVHDPELRAAALRLRDVLRPATGLEVPVVPRAAHEDAGACADHVHPGARAGDDARAATVSGGRIVFAVEEGLVDEGYRLEVAGEGILVSASAELGALRAVETLRQLLPDGVYRRGRLDGVVWSLPAVRIADGPAFAWRGLMLDVARHFFTVAEVLRLIDQLAVHKLNVLHLHLTDDQGWRLQIDRFPRLTGVGGWRPESQLGAPRGSAPDGRPHGGFYTADDAREIVAYAAGRGITVVPEIEMPGHVQAALAAYPELGVAGGVEAPWTSWGVNPNVLNLEESTVSFFCDVLDAVIDIFPSAYIGIGGDECPKTQWENDPRSRERMAELGVGSAHEAQSWFIHRIDAHLASRGRRSFGWDEILEGGLAPGATVASWRGTSGLVTAARAGHDAVACPEDVVYLDYRQSESADEPIPVSIVTDVERVYGFDPVPDELEPEHRARILGGQANLWTEHVEGVRRLDYMLFPRLSALAEVLWSGPGRDVDDFSARLSAHLGRLDALGIEYRPAAGPRPWQQIPSVPGRTFTREERAAQVAAQLAESAGTAPS